jgi:acyl-CoA hydrolase
VRAGLAEYLPLRASDVRAEITGNVDVLLLRISPPDRDGWCSTGPTASFTRAAVETARLVIAEIDPDLPRTSGDSRVHVSETGRLVTAEDPTPYYPGPSRDDPRIAVIAEHVAGLIPEGATVQLGLGAVTEAVGELLGRRSDPFGPASPGGRPSGPPGLRVLGMITEQMISLVEASSGTAVAVELMGGPKLMAWADRNARVEMTSSDRVHDPVFLSRIAAFVSVNSAASVDLTGQVVSDAIGGRVVSGIGGSADFFEGAHLSPGGLRILALTSTTARGRPAIVPEHPAGTQVTIPRHSVDVVVTEHGVAWLRGRTVGERREALLSIAGGGDG